MKRFKYIIVDDEYPIQVSVKQYFKAYPNYTCVATFSDPKQALNYLQTHEIDLIFVDIEMPEMNGFQFVETLQKNIFVVFLTAYPNRYSEEAHRYNIEKNLMFFTNKAQFLYYLPKILTHFEAKYAEKEILDRVEQLSKNEIKTFPIMINNQPIPLEKIAYIMVVGHNIVLTIMDGEELVFRMSFRELTNLLPAHIFYQIKRNLIINICHVSAFSDTTVCIENQHFTIPFRKRKKVISILKMQREILYDHY